MNIEEQTDFPISLSDWKGIKVKFRTSTFKIVLYLFMEINSYNISYMASLLIFRIFIENLRCKLKATD